MSTEALEDRIASFEQWHYEFDLDGVKTPIFRAEHRNRHRQRRDYLFGPLLDVCGGTLAGRRVLDLGCNAGYWALACLDHGAEYVLGVDGRQMHIDQAHLVFESKRIDRARYDFEQGDVFDVDYPGTFDIVLCLGLLYHVSKPMELLELMGRVGTDLAVIDTTLSGLPGRTFKLQLDDMSDPRSAFDRSLVMYPSRDAVRMVARAAGFRSVVALEPRFSHWTGCADYRLGTRRAFLCRKDGSLSVPDESLGLVDEVRPVVRVAHRHGRRIVARGVRAAFGRHTAGRGS